MPITFASRKLSWLAGLAFAAFVMVGLGSTGQAQAAIPYHQILLLVAGPSGDRIDPREKAVVDHLNSLRGSYNFSQLQMGTMHYDRPQEAALLKNTLGFSPQKGVTVGLVQLSEQGLPVRTLYKLEQVTQASLLAAQNDLLSRWSRTTGQPLPAELRPAGSVGGPSTTNAVVTNPTTPPVTSNGEPWITPSVRPSQVYSFEGIRAVIVAVDDRSSGMWASLMNAPLRSDGNDLAVREQTKALADATLALREANANGVIYPLDQLATVSRIGLAWKKSEPQYYLPVVLRTQVEPLTNLLQQIAEIETQGRAAKTSP